MMHFLFLACGYIYFFHFHGECGVTFIASPRIFLSARQEDPTARKILVHERSSSSRIILFRCKQGLKYEQQL